MVVVFGQEHIQIQHYNLHSEGAQQKHNGLFYGSEASSTLHHLDCSLVAASDLSARRPAGRRPGAVPPGAAIETCGVAVLGVCHREREQREGALLLVLWGSDVAGSKASPSLAQWRLLSPRKFSCWSFLLLSWLIIALREMKRRICKYDESGRLFVLSSFLFFLPL